MRTSMKLLVTDIEFDFEDSQGTIDREEQNLSQRMHLVYGMLTQKMNWLTKSQIQLVGVSSRLTINQMHPIPLPLSCNEFY